MISKVIQVVAVLGSVTSISLDSLFGLDKQEIIQFQETGVLVIEKAINEDLVRTLSEHLVHCSMTDHETDVFRSSTLDGSLRATFASEASEPFKQCSTETRLLAHDYKLITREIGLRVARFLDSLQSGTAPKIEALIRQPEASSLDHFHVYRPSDIEETSTNTQKSSLLSVPFHVDMGLFLLLTPATWMNTTPISLLDSDLIVKKKDGSIFEVRPRNPGSVILLSGAGLSNWLNRGTSTIRAAVHAVNPLENIQGGSRVVLGRMFLPPMNTVSESGVRFEDFFMSSSKIIKAEAVDQSSARWRRLMEARCEAGKKYCWMDCMPDVDCGEDSESVCMNPNTGNICLETDCDTDCTVMCPPRPPTLTPQLLPVSLNESRRSSNNNSVPVPYRGDVSTRASQQAAVPVVVTVKGDQDLFCRGGTSMVMSGFESVGSVNANCIILFFRPWLLDSPLKFAIGCLGVFLLGILVEATIKLRRFATNKLTLSKRIWRETVVISLFAVNVALGYLCMLAAMTFNVEIFISTVMGLAIGHLLLGNSSEPVRETADPCCVTSEATNSAGVTTTLVNSTGACCCDARPRI
jgi:hypothetical protein